MPSRELPRYQSWFPADANPGLIFISLPDSELGIGRIRTLFLLLAEQWRLSRFIPTLLVLHSIIIIIINYYYYYYYLTICTNFSLV